MLKIKDNIDLKELEKFGFRKENPDYVIDIDRIPSFGEKDLAYLYIDCNDRTLHLYVEYDDEEYNIDIVYDLIQAGFVEKVGKE